MWQDYFAQHGYLEQTAGWQLALEGLLGEALTPVAFPEKASWKAMTKDGLPLLQHSELQEHMAEAAAASFGRAISELLASEQLTMPDGLRQSFASMRTFTDTPEEAAAFFALLLQQADARIHAFAEARGLHETGLRLLGWAVVDALVPAEAKDAAVWEEIEWKRNYCPVCGRPPVLAVLRKEQQGRARFLVCDGCHTVWPYARVGCAYCGNQDLEKMKVLEPEGEEEMRLDVCEECYTYLKTYQGGKQRDPKVPDGPDVSEIIYRHDWATLHLDLLAQEQGLVKRGSVLLAAAPVFDEGEEK